MINATSGQICVGDKAITSNGALVKSRRKFTLGVSVTDGKFTSTAEVIVRTAKSDGSGLAFSKKKYYASVLENSTQTDIKVIVDVLGRSGHLRSFFSL